MKMKVPIAGAEINCSDEGLGEVIVFLHAFPLSLAMWDEQATALATSYRVVRYDDRGFGGSPVGDGALTMDRIADDAAAILDHLSIDRAVVCGCSMGGYAALAFARRHPQRLRGLVLQDTRAGADTPEARGRRSELAKRVLEEGPEAVAAVFVPGLLGSTTRASNPGLVARVRETILANPRRGIANALIGLGARPDSVSTLPGIRVPTLVLCGAEDVLTPPAESEALHAGLADSRLEIVAEAGHLSNMEKPEVVNRLLASFLAHLG
jgi:pimeloyl-ACP methyl ester carboxylesterase